MLHEANKAQKAVNMEYVDLSQKTHIILIINVLYIKSKNSL